MIASAVAFCCAITACSGGAGVAASNTNAANTANRTAATPAPNENPFIAAATAPETVAPESSSKSWPGEMLEIILRLSVAVILSGILAFRPRRDVPLFKRSLFVSQTQILLAVVAAALMMIVGDNTARAFAIFAAVSLVRFRTNIRDPKEITVLLISLALGLAAGVGRFELGVALCLFALALIWLLEYKESDQVRSMEVTINTRNTEATQALLKKLFKRYKLESEVRGIDPPTEEAPIGSIVYYLNLRLNVSTDYLSDRMLRMDPHNIEKILWVKTKNAADIYQ